MGSPLARHRRSHGVLLFVTMANVLLLLIGYWAYMQAANELAAARTALERCHRKIESSSSSSTPSPTPSSISSSRMPPAAESSSSSRSMSPSSSCHSLKSLHSIFADMYESQTTRRHRPEARSLVAINTSNQWARTAALLDSLDQIDDDIDVLVVDDNSKDSTQTRLRERGVRFVSTTEPQGPTHCWNLAYQEWRRGSYANFFIINNDVLIANGTFTRLDAHLRAPGVVLVSPMSSTLGSGSMWRHHGLPGRGDLGPWQRVQQKKARAYATSHPRLAAATAFVQQAHNYQRVSAVLAQVCESERLKLARAGVLGFFMGMNRQIVRYAFATGDPGLLWNPANRITRQEVDLWSRFKQDSLFPHIATDVFVYHFKGSTLTGSREDKDLHIYHAASESA